MNREYNKIITYQPRVLNVLSEQCLLEDPAIGALPALWNAKLFLRGRWEPSYWGERKKNGLNLKTVEWPIIELTPDSSYYCDDNCGKRKTFHTRSR